MNLHSDKPARVGEDVGFGVTKAEAWIDDEYRTITFPSVLGQAQTLDSYRTGIGGGRRTKARAIEVGGLAYYVGQDALTHSRAQGMRQDRNRIGSDQELILALAALAALDISDALIVTGVPVLWWDHRRALVEKWTGRHAITYGGQQRIITIRQVKVVPQPLGGFYSWALGEDGTAQVPEAELLKPYALLDVGWNTCDLTAVDQLRPVERWSGGEQVGIRKVAEIIRDMVQRQHGLTIDPHEADAAIHTRQVQVYGEPVDVGPAVDAALATVADQVLARATELWGSGERFKSVLIFGGGAALLGKRLLAAFPRNGLPLPDPGTANARGFARYARRAKTFSAGGAA